VTLIPAEGPYVTYYKHTIDDDTLETSYGNGDGQVNPGELIELLMWVKNWGNETVYQVQGVLSADDPYVTITDSTEVFGDVASEDTVIAPDDYDFEVSLDCPNGHIIGFTLRCRDDQDSSWVSYARVMVKAAVVVYDTFQVDDSGSSQPNGGVDPGETVNLIVELKNKGYADASGVEALLSSGDGYVSIINGEGDFGDIPAGGSAANSGSPYIISVAPQCPRGHPINFSLDITSDWGYASVDSFVVGVNGIFTDVTDIAGVGDIGFGVGVAWGDYDKDGHLDIHVSNGRSGTNLLYHNNGDGTFTNTASTAGVATTGYGKGASFGDFDNDGDLDLYVVYLNGLNFLFENQGDGTFTDITSSAGVSSNNAGESVSWGDLDNDGDLDLYLANFIYPNVLFINNSDGTFTNIACEAGIEDPDGGGIGSSLADYDNDGDLDIYVANGTYRGDGDPVSRLYRNNGDGTFTDVAVQAGVAHSGDAMSADFGDYNNDGYLDIFIVNRYNELNALFKNNGDGTFADVTVEAGLVDSCESVGFSWGDFDNDGFLDIFITNSDQPNILYRNNGDGTFTQAVICAGGGPRSANGHVACGDYDCDGALDLYITRSQEPNILYRNNGNENHWLYIRTHGFLSNRDGIGARIRVVADALNIIREVRSGNGYASQNSLPVEFGLGQYPQADSVIIYWPSGVVDTFYSVMANKFYTAIEGSNLVGIEENRPITRPKDFSLSQNYPNPFNPFTKISYSCPRDCEVRLNIYNVLGQRVRVLVNERKRAGYYYAIWDGRDEKGRQVGSGIYFSRMEAGDFKSTKKMVPIR